MILSFSRQSMNKIPCASQNTKATTLPADAVSLVALDGFHLLLSTQLTTDLSPGGSGGSIFHPLSHIYAKTYFCCVETVANNALNRRRVVVFDRLWANAAPILNTSFLLTNKMQNGEYTVFWYLQLLYYLTQL